jgi:hypothetical protein
MKLWGDTPPVDREAFLKTFNSIDGYFTEYEALRAYEMARFTRGFGVIVEIGSYKGKSTYAWASGAVDVPIYSIDIAHDPIFEENMKRTGVMDRIRIVRGDSTTIGRSWALPVELLFIDGSHDYSAVKADLEGWLPHVVPGGFVALHDAGGYWPDPTKIAHEVLVCNQTTRFYDVRVIDSLCHARVRMKRKYPVDYDSVNGGLPWKKPF